MSHTTISTLPMGQLTEEYRKNSVELCDPDGVVGKRNPCTETNIPPNRLGIEDLSLITKRKQQADEILRAGLTGRDRKGGPAR